MDWWVGTLAAAYISVRMPMLARGLCAQLHHCANAILGQQISQAYFPPEGDGCCVLNDERYCIPEDEGMPAPRSDRRPVERRKQISIANLFPAGHRLLIWSAMNRRKMNWALPVALAVLLCLSPYCFAASKNSAKSLYQQGQLAETKGDIITAYDDYVEAFKKDPKDLRYKTAQQRTFSAAGSAHVDRGEKLRDQGDYTGAMTEFLRALEVDPSNDLARQDIQALKEKLSAPRSQQETSVSPGETSQLRSVSPPVQLKPVSNEPITLHMTEDSKVVYETVGKAAGINVLFDPEYTSKRIQVDLANVSLLDALRILGTVSGTFWHPVTSNTIFVALDSRAKRQQLEVQAVQTFYLSNIAQQNDLNDIQTALRNLLANAKLYAVQSQNAIVMRATPDELLLAQKLIEDLDKSRPEVVVDVSLLEVNRDKLRNIGLQLPGSVGLQLQAPNATTTPSATNGTTTVTTTGTTQNLTLNNLAHINATDVAVTVGAATANLLLTDSDTKVLQNPSIRASDGQKADFKVGERIPVATGSYQTGAATAIVSSLVNTQFTYLDVGGEVEITPIVHYDNDITLKIKLVSSQESSSTNIGGITEPIISQRTAEQTVRLREGEVNILGGYMLKQDLLTVGGTPGLGEIPILKYFFSSQQREVQDDEIVFMITPHLVRGSDITPQNLQEIDTGTGANIELRRVSAPEPVPLINPQAAARPNASPPGQAALPNAASASPPGQAALPNAASASPPPSNSQAVKMQLAAATTPFKVGSAFQVALNLDGGKNAFSVPVQLHYDQTKLSLINVDSGDYLGHDGKAVTLVHRDSGSGEVAISASRPPGAPGIDGAGTLCVLTFQATNPGDAQINVRRASIENSAQQPTAVDVAGASTTIHIQ
jgi:general secretion pathway protein D